MSLSNLPHELLLSISDLLEELRYISALARTNKSLYWHLNHYLYSLDKLRTGGSALVWAAKNGLRRTAWLSLTQGADIEALHWVVIPRPLRCLGFHYTSARMTPFQIALCYGYDSVARLLIDHGAITSTPYPFELCSCTNLHMAAAMGLASTLKILIGQGMDVEARDRWLRTPLHYAATMQHRNSPEQGQVVIRLLAHNADPWTEDSQGRRPASVGKKRSNLVAKMISEKGVVVDAYEISLQDQELFEMWRISKEKKEEAAWEKEKRELQFATKPAKRERHNTMKKKRAAAKKKDFNVGSCKEEAITRQTEVQTAAQKDAKDRAHKPLAAQEVVGEARTGKTRLEVHHALTEAWSRMRKEADHRALAATQSGLRLKADCYHVSGLWKCKARKTCKCCGISAKWLSLCADCGFVVCMRCNVGKGRA